MVFPNRSRQEEKWTATVLLNAVTRKDSYPLPLIDETFEARVVLNARPPERILASKA